MRRVFRTLLAGLVASAALQAQDPQRRFTLDNGLPVLLQEDPGSPLFRARLRLALRPGDQPPSQAGLQALFLRMLDGGLAGHLSPAAFDAALDDAGLRLSRRVTAEAITWDLVARSRDQDRAMALLADRVLRPILDPARLEAQRLACWRAEEAARLDPATRLQRVLDGGVPAPPTEQGLGPLTLRDLEAFRGRVFRPSRATLVLAGDLGLEQAKALVWLSFGTWSDGAARWPSASRQAPSWLARGSRRLTTRSASQAALARSRSAWP